MVIFGPPVLGRKCGSCHACCTLVPVVAAELDKPANVRCPHVFSHGCRIYAARPEPCQVWSCRWLIDAETRGLRRPDHAGYIIDPMTDTILANDNPYDCLQVWCDPRRRDAHRDPALRAYLATFDIPAIVRWSDQEGCLLVHPGIGKEGEWLELYAGLLDRGGMANRLEEVNAASRATD